MIARLIKPATVNYNFLAVADYLTMLLENKQAIMNKESVDLGKAKLIHGIALCGNISNNPLISHTWDFARAHVVCDDLINFMNDRGTTTLSIHSVLLYKFFKANPIDVCETIEDQVLFPVGGKTQWYAEKADTHWTNERRWKLVEFMRDEFIKLDTSDVVGLN